MDDRFRNHLIKITTEGGPVTETYTGYIVKAEYNQHHYILVPSPDCDATDSRATVIYDAETVELLEGQPSVKPTAQPSRAAVDETTVKINGEWS